MVICPLVSVFFCFVCFSGFVFYFSGFVYLYHLPTDKSWTSLDLSQPSRIVSTNQDHINAIAIGDDGGGPCVVIATEGTFLTVVQWRRKTG